MELKLSELGFLVTKSGLNATATFSTFSGMTITLSYKESFEYSHSPVVIRIMGGIVYSGTISSEAFLSSLLKEFILQMVEYRAWPYVEEELENLRDTVETQRVKINSLERREYYLTCLEESGATELMVDTEEYDEANKRFKEQYPNHT